MNNLSISSMPMKPFDESCVCADTPQSPATNSGILVLDKPTGMTSFSLVARTKKILGLKKVGHCGTLDPFATGVMILCLDQATRVADQLSLQDKLYQFTIHFGVETDTLDRTGQIVNTYDGPPVSRDDLSSVLTRFTGRLWQQVPRYAAVKVQGRRLYELSRKGIEVVNPPEKEVTIHDLKLLTFQWPEAELVVHCSKGTYVRQLAADLGRTLHCGAHVKELRRLASGAFEITQAISLEQLKEAVKNNLWRAKLLTMSEALAHLPAITIGDPYIIKGIHHGRLDCQWEFTHRQKMLTESGPCRLLTGEGRLLALWWPEQRQNAGENKRCLRVFVE